MELTEYLNTILDAQALATDSVELQQLRSHRVNVEAILRAHFASSSPTIRYGGSIAKRTLIRDSYDLDVICYFEHDDERAGGNLGDIFHSAQQALAEAYIVRPKTSALRLQSKDPETYLQDFHIDVIPGRYVDETRSDCYIHQAGNEKIRLKTNLDTHIAHIRDSGLTPMIRAMKLWNVHNGVGVKTFILELLVVKLLQGSKMSLGDQFIAVLAEIRDNANDLRVEDPANPTGNDLSGALNDGMRLSLSSVASATLSHIEDKRYTRLFGDVAAVEDRTATLASVVSSVGGRGLRPWCP